MGALSAFLLVPEKVGHGRLVAVQAQAADLAHAGGGGDAPVPELLSLVDVGYVHLDAGHVHRLEGVQDGVGVVGIRPGVQHDGVVHAVGGVDGVENGPLVVGLDALRRGAVGGGELLQPPAIGFLEFEIQEIRQAKLSRQEDETLEETYRRMTNGKKIVGNLEEAYEYTGGTNSETASEAISRALRCMQEAAGCDEQAQDMFQQLAEIDSLLNDFNRELSDYKMSFDFSEETFFEVETRLNEINRLKAKYGNSIEEILEYCDKKEERLLKLQDYDAYLAQLQKKDEIDRIRRKPWIILN